MAIGAGVAAIIAALIGAGVSIGTGVASNSQSDKAQREARRLANIRRQDELMMFEENKKLTKEQLKLQKQQIGFNRDAELYERKERGLERGMAARENSFNKSLSLLNGNETLRANFLNNWRRK